MKEMSHGTQAGRGRTLGRPTQVLPRKGYCLIWLNDNAEQQRL
jgi:hypothetical protein